MRRKQADGNHDQYVINAAERVSETVCKAGGVADPGMRVRRSHGGRQQRRGKREQT
jgi:hypothetical protein